MNVIELHRPSAHVAEVWLNRPEVRNAFNEELITALTQTFAALSAEPGLRVIQLGARGKAFCAGADLNWMRAMADFSWEQNRADAQKLADMLWTLDQCPVPIVGRVQGGRRQVSACLQDLCTPHLWRRGADEPICYFNGVSASGKDKLANTAILGFGELTQVHEQRRFEDKGEDHGHGEERWEQDLHHRILGERVGHHRADQREEDDDLGHLRKEVVVISDVRRVDAKGAIAEEADDQSEDELRRRPRREEDGKPDEGDLAQAFKDLEPVRAELVVSGQLAQRRRQPAT